MELRLAVWALGLGLFACDPSTDPGQSGDGTGGSSGSDPTSATDTASTTDTPPVDDCETTVESDLPGVSIEIDSPCSHTLAEAQAGVTTTYTVAIEEALSGVDSGKMCFETPDGGIHVDWYVRSDEMVHCNCDVGPCPDYEPMPTGLSPGDTVRDFEWAAFDWNGESDTNQPYGAAFPPGTYTIEVIATGFWDDGTNAQTPFTVRATRPVVLQ